MKSLIILIVILFVSISCTVYDSRGNVKNFNESLRKSKIKQVNTKLEIKNITYNENTNELYFYFEVIYKGETVSAVLNCKNPENRLYNLVQTKRYNFYATIIEAYDNHYIYHRIKTTFYKQEHPNITNIADRSFIEKIKGYLL